MHLDHSNILMNVMLVSAIFVISSPITKKSHSPLSFNANGFLQDCACVKGVATDCPRCQYPLSDMQSGGVGVGWKRGVMGEQSLIFVSQSFRYLIRGAFGYK